MGSKRWLEDLDMSRQVRIAGSFQDSTGDSANSQVNDCLAYTVHDHELRGLLRDRPSASRLSDFHFNLPSPS